MLLAGVETNRKFCYQDSLNIHQVLTQTYPLADSKGNEV